MEHANLNAGQKNIGKRGTPMAWACVVLGCGATLGGMWWLTRDVKQNERMHSPYGAPPTLPPRTESLIQNPVLTESQGQGINGTDKAMTSSDVAKVASGVPTPDSERMPGAVHRSR
ncbi:hypothetical protein NMY22_g633 [Coprinellus aureogranulatus]|nr:hypothetical protein NMY22_g633 [Coprinellus aureogranulatus]